MGCHRRNKTSNKQQWRCIERCGACCHLDPSERMEALERLNGKQLQIFLDLVGEDGWCRHYDKNQRKCKIYDERPDFCHVSSLKNLYHLEDEEVNLFAINCCKQQIRFKYGGRSKEMRKFTRALNTDMNKDGRS